MKLSELQSSLITDLEDIFSRHANVCLWLSGGSDSRLLLETLLDRKYDFSILRFSDGWTRQQKRAFDRLTLEHDLTVYSYAANSHTLAGEKGRLALISEYAVGGNGAFIPIVRDIVTGFRCAFEISLEVSDAPRPPISFDAHIFGSRRADRHFIFGRAPVASEKSFRLGRSRVYAPLLDWKKSQVIAGLRRLGASYEKPTDELDTGNISACTNCLTDENPFCPKTGTTIEKVAFDGKKNLTAIRARLGIAKGEKNA